MSDAPKTALLLLGSICLFIASAAAQTRDAWRYKRGDRNVITQEDIDGRVVSLNSTQKEQIRQALRKQLSDRGAPSDREAVARMFVKHVKLGASPHKQLVLWANQSDDPGSFCGATGNCTVWLFVQDKTGLRLVLVGLAAWIVVEKAAAGGMHDVTFCTHMSAFESDYVVYRWMGTAYQQSDSYSIQTSSRPAN